MNLIDRLRTRIHTDGILKTLKYLFLASCYCLRECICNIYLDLRYSHKILKGNIKTAYKNLGANDTYHSKFSVLPIIFNLLKVSKDDVLVDVGCGKGRVINYWLFKKFRNKIIGLELDEKIAAQAAKDFRHKKNVTIIPGNAIDNLPKDGTIFYFYNPFSKEVVAQFEKKLSEMDKNKPITVIYYNPKSVEVFRNPKWQIRNINFEKDLGYRRWGRINKYHDLAIIKRR